MSEVVSYRPGVGLRLESADVSAPGPGQVAVDIMATGVCHSDLHIVNGDWPTDQPLVLGHEGAGIVVAVGDSVTDVAPGDHVVLSWFASCRRCPNCAAGRAWLCTRTTALDNTLPDGTTPFRDAEGEPLWPYLGLGTYSPHVVVPEAAAIKVPHELPFAVGALLGCSVTTGVGAVINTAEVPVGASALVVGCGGVGLSIVMGLRLAGATTIIAADISDEKLRLVRRLGATDVVNSAQTDLASVVAAAGGVDFAFEAIGNPRLIESMPPLLKPGGALVLAGMTAFGARCSIDPFDLADQGKSVLGCNYGSSVASIDVPRLAALFLNGQLPVDELVGATRHLAEASDALDDLAAGAGLRTILVPRGVKA